MKKYIFLLILASFFNKNGYTQTSLWRIAPKVALVTPLQHFVTKPITPDAKPFSRVTNLNFVQRGISIGAIAEKSLSPQSALRTEALLFFRENAMLQPLDSNGTLAFYHWATTLQVPVMLVFQPTKAIHFEGGLLGSYILKAKPKVGTIANRANLGFALGMLGRFQHFELGVRYTHDFFALAHHNDTVQSITTEYKRDMQFSVGYWF